MAAEDTFGLAIAQCHGAFGLPLLNTWISLGLDAAFVLLSSHGIVLMVKGITTARAPGLLHSVNLVG
jgi:hypothetical protein